MKTGLQRKARSHFAHLLFGMTIMALIILSAGDASAADGELLWAKRAVGSSGEQEGYGISTFSDGSSVVTGYFQGTTTFGTGTTLVSASRDIFIARYNADGTLAWAKSAGGVDWDEGYGISSFSDGSSVVTGYFSGTATFGTGTTLVSAGDYDIFIARYNANGTLAWAKRAGGNDSDGGCGISSFSDGTCVVTGYFEDTATFGTGTTLVSSGARDIFIAKYDANGTLAWAKSAGGVAYEYGRRISAFSDGTSVVTGQFGATAVFGATDPNPTTLVSDANSTDIFIAKYDANGTLVWATRAGGIATDEGHGISTLSNGISVVTGSFSGTATFGTGTTLVSAGGYDIFVARYNADGTLAWATRVGGTGSDIGKGISAFSDSTSVVTGQFYGTAIFGEHESNETTLESAGDRDIFVARYGGPFPPTPVWINCQPSAEPIPFGFTGKDTAEQFGNPWPYWGWLP